MDATQIIRDSILESDEEENKEEIENKRGRPLAKLCVLKNEHIPETELPLFLGDNVLGRDPHTCALPLPAPSISKQHATICISVYRRRGCHSEVEALIWDRGSMNGTRKGHLKLTPNVRYALSEGDSLVVADVPCQYVSCPIGRVSSEGDTVASVSKHSGVNAKWPDGSGEEGGDTNTGGKKCVDGDTQASVLLPDQDDSGKTFVTTSCLSFEQTPTQPRGTLVPESDSDSDDKRGDGRRKATVSNFEFHGSSPACSTFLSPTNKVVPESEDESPITPPSSGQNRPHRHVIFTKEDQGVEVGQQQLKNENTIRVVDNNAEEEGGEKRVVDNNAEEEGGEKRAALAGSKSEESEHNVSGKRDSNVRGAGENELEKSSVTFLTDAIPVFDMDSDTDEEGEEGGGASASPANQQADPPPNTAHFYIDSDTDDDERVHKSVPPSADHTKPLHVISVIQPEGITFDSDTDVDEDAASEAAIVTASLQSPNALVSSPSMQRNNLHQDSDTDIEEEAQNRCGRNSLCSKIDETPNRLDIKSTGPESTLDSGTEEGAVPAVGELSVVSAVTESVTTADLAAVLGCVSDGDTDVEDDSSLLVPVVAANWSINAGILPDSDADRDVDESSVSPAGDEVDPADTDVEDEENQVPRLRRENPPGLLVPLQQNCSTPVQTSGGELEDLETQAFLIPSSSPFGRLRPISLSPCSASAEDDCVVAETQSFLLPARDSPGSPLKFHNKDPIQSFVREKCKQSTRGESFQLGLFQSSHLEGQAQALATETTQAFVSVVEGGNLEDTQAYADRTSLENDSNLQPHGEDQEPARCSKISAKDGHVDFSMEATQAYISEPDSDSEVETDEDERKNTAAAETQPFYVTSSSTIALAETQPMFNIEEEEEEEEEESLDHTNPIPAVLQVKSSSQPVTEEKEEQMEAAQPVAETQPMHVSEDEEIDGEELLRQKPKAKQLWLEEPTRTLTICELSLVETQPLHIGQAETRPLATSGEEEGDVGDLIPGPGKRKAKQLWLEDVQIPTLANSELPTVETPVAMATCKDSESDEEDSTPGPRKRRAKLLQIEDEAEPLAVVETQRFATCISEQRNDKETSPGPRKRKAKSLPLEEEETQPLTVSEVSAVEARPTVAEEERESDDEDSIPGPRKRRAKPPQKEDSTKETKSVPPPQRGKGKQAEAGTSGPPIGGKRTTRARLREEEEQAECSEPPKRRTSRAMKALANTTPTVRRGKARRNEESVKEEEVQQAKQAFTVDPKDGKVDEQTLETGRKNIENNNLEKQKAREEQYKLQTDRKEEDEHERLQSEDAEKLILEQERAERETIEKSKEEDEKKIADRAQKEREEQLEQERNKKEENERHEKEEGEEKERIEKEREKEEKYRLKTAKREQEEKLERERIEQEKQAKEQQGNQREENSPKTTATGRRTARRTPAAQDSTTSANDDVPARRTRSRSNSSNSLSSERSASSVSTQGSSGRGRGAKRQAAVHRRTVAAEPTPRDICDVSPQGVLSRSNSEISGCTLSSHSRGRGGRQRGRGRKTESGSQSGQNLALQPTTRGRRGRTAEGPSNELHPEGEMEEADSQPATTSRGRQRANANDPKPAAGDKKSPSSQKGARKDSPLPKRNVLGGGPKAVKSESVELPVAPAVSDGEEAKEKTKGRRRESKANAKEDSSWSSKISEAKERTQTIEAAHGETTEKTQVQVLRKGRASSAQAKKTAKDSSADSEVKEESEEMDEGTVRRRVRGRPSVVQKLKKEKQEEKDQDPHVDAPQPQTPTSSGSRKRRALTDSSPVAKTPRSSSASPAAGGQFRASRQAYKVLFTGVVDEDGERVLARLGGSMAEGVADMNCLVTDKVRRTVKFLCALAKGVPIVTTHWLERSGRAGSFLSPNAFVVKDPEQEKKFSFCLQDSLGIASSHRLLQGYQIHVTKSVKPEPVHMKDIISCSGATFLPKMPSSHKPQTVVISCEEDLPLCGTALSESLPVVTAEFILTGILRQKVDLQTHKLSVPANTQPPAGGRGRSRRKT
ncbi:mediator of DNA damage checkpoint protein 1 isoform 1-T3 [Spinachia spinachia]